MKVNDRVEFPHVLNMNNYMQGYSNIQNKLNEDTAAYFVDKVVTAPKSKGMTGSSTSHSKVTTKSSVLSKKSGVTNVAGKIVTKPSVNTKSFLA